MKLMKFVKNAKGVGLVEVMMAVAISGGLALTIAKLMDNAGQNAKQIEAKSENTSLKGVLQDVLNNTTACTNTFGVVMTPANVSTLSGSTTATVTVPNIKDKVNSIKYSTASTNINPLTITSMDITNYSPTAQTGDLVVQSTFRKSSSMVMMVKPIRIPINFSFISGAFSSCSTMAVGGEWLLGGNAGTVDGTDYIGTSDNTALNFRVNAQKAGRIDPLGPVFLGARSGFSNTANLNTGIGYYALNANTSGDANTALGYQALMTNTTGAGNTAMGNGALRANTTGTSNIAMGSGALYFNTTASSSTAIGDDALSSNTTASFNTALGAKSLTATTTGAENVAVGAIAMQTNSTGRYNTGIGAFAMEGNTTGSENTAVGRSVFARNTTGSYNALLGNYAGWFATNGSYNTYIGHRAGYNHTSGNNNIFIGYNSGTNVTASSNRLYMDTTSNTTSLIGADFSARTINLAGTTTFDVPSYGISMKLPSNSAIRSTTTSTTDKIYFDTRALFRDAASGGNGFVGIAGGLGVGSGSYWDATAVPAQGSVQIEDKLAVGTTVAGMAASTKAYIYEDTMPAGGIGLYTLVRPTTSGGSWSTAINGSNISTGIGTGSFTVGVRAAAHNTTAAAASRMYGLYTSAGNGTDGYNYAIYATISGSNKGTALYATANQVFPQDMTVYTGGSLAGMFEGNVWVTGNHSAVAHPNTSDRRLKKDIYTLENSLEKLLRLRGVRYKWKKDEAKNGEQLGVIAQEVEKEFPQVVITGKNKEAIKQVNYASFVGPFIEAIKELYSKIVAIVASDEKQNVEIKNLKEENAKLKADMKAQQAAFDERLKKLEAKSK